MSHCDGEGISGKGKWKKKCGTWKRFVFGSNIYKLADFFFLSRTEFE